MLQFVRAIQWKILLRGKTFSKVEVEMLKKKKEEKLSKQNDWELIKLQTEWSIWGWNCSSRNEIMSPLKFEPGPYLAYDRALDMQVGSLLLTF